MKRSGKALGGLAFLAVAIATVPALLHLDDGSRPPSDSRGSQAMSNQEDRSRTVRHRDQRQFTLKRALDGPAFRDLNPVGPEDMTYVLRFDRSGQPVTRR